MVLLMTMNFESEVKAGVRRSSRREPAGNFAAHRTFEPQLQRAAGNQAIQSLLRSSAIHASLALGHVDDPAEAEAEQVAAQITSPESANEIANRENNPSTIHRAPSGGPAVTNVPGLVERLLQSSGRPLDHASRGFFEPRFGRDFSDVRVHTGPEASASARSINAQAYTAGPHIVFDSTQYSPESHPDLLAHELAHVVQQSPEGARGTSRNNGTLQPVRGDRSQAIRRSPATKPKPEPSKIADNANDQDAWRDRVDAAVRKTFDLSGPGLTVKNVKFLDEVPFQKQFSKADLVEKLTYLFWAGGGDVSTIPGKILASYDNQGGLLNPTPPDPRTRPEVVADVIRDAFKDGYFWYHFLTDPYTTITPRELVSYYFVGITDIDGPVADHSITMQVYNHSSPVGTLVHETCHFYVNPAFVKAASARKDGNDLLGGALINKILIEGFAEFFAREVMDANAAELGPRFGDAYPLEVEQAKMLADSLGEQTIRDAYFKGDAGAIKKLMAEIDKSKAAVPAAHKP